MTGENSAYDPNTFERLKASFGSHSDVARELGVSVVYYRYLRRTKRLPPYIQSLISLIDGWGVSGITGDELTKEHFERLKARFGSHSNVARRLGLSIEGYRRVRRTLKASPAVVKLIILASDVAGQVTPITDGKYLPSVPSFRSHENQT